MHRQTGEQRDAVRRSSRRLLSGGGAPPTVRQAGHGGDEAVLDGAHRFGRDGGEVVVL